MPKKMHQAKIFELQFFFFFLGNKFGAVFKHTCQLGVSILCQKHVIIQTRIFQNHGRLIQRDILFLEDISKHCLPLPACLPTLSLSLSLSPHLSLSLSLSLALSLSLFLFSLSLPLSLYLLSLPSFSISLSLSIYLSS